MADNLFEEMMGRFQDIQKHHDQKDEYLSKLQSEPCCQVPKVGDSVIIAAGMINRGHLWVRIECEVISITGTSIKVKHTGTNEYQTWEEWIDPIIVLDVLTESGEN